MLKCEKSFFHDETHYWAVLVRQGNAKENYSCLKPLLSLSSAIRQIKISCAKYKIAERSHNFLMQLPMQLIFGVSWDLDKLQICAKGKSILEFHSVWKGNPKNSKKSKKLKHNKKVPKNGLTEPPFGEYMFIWLVRHPYKRKIHSGIPFAR